MNISNKNVQDLYAISFRIPTRIFVQHQKMILKCTWNSKISTVLTFLKKRSKGLVLPNIKTYYKTAFYYCFKK